MALRASMETDLDKETMSLSKIDDQSTSDVVVRLRTQEGRDARFYCHSHILTEKSRYFAERLSENWPTCQILDSRDCVEVYCQESEFDHHVAALRLLYAAAAAVTDDGSHHDHDPWHGGVRNALGILQVTVKLGCEQMVSACVDYLEAVPWEEAEEEEILKVIPSLGSEVEPILARLQPVNPTAIRDIFLSTIRFATSSPPPSMIDLKCSAQDQLEYMLVEDDDAPLLTADDELKSQVRERMRILLSRFYGLLDAILLSQPKEEAIFEADMLQHLLPLLSDLAWACMILAKMEIMRDFVHSWVETSEKIVKAVQDTTVSKPEMLDITVKVLLVASKVLEAIAYGSVILPTAKRLHMVKVWLPLVRMTKPLMKPASEELKTDTDQWQSLESAFVSMVLALPSGDQAEILNEWLGSKHIEYPDLTEAFELWCYRSKVAKRRLSMLGNFTSVTN